MYKVVCLLSLVCLTFTNVATWDFAVTFDDKIEFYSDLVKRNTEGVFFNELTAITYDAVHNVLYFVDKQTDNASIFSYNLVTKKFDAIITGASDNSIQGIAFDPVSRILFWTDSEEKSISWTSLDAGSNKTIHKNVLIKMAEDMPKGIAVDSCRGYIYWTNINVSRPTIERARFNGSERETIIDTDIFMPVSIAIDQKTKTLYWADDKEGIHFEIQSSDLDGKNRNKIYKGVNHQPNSLTVSNDSIYWIDWSFKSVWKLRKDLRDEPKNIVDFTEKPFGIVANYHIDDQIQGIPECRPLMNISHSTSDFNEPLATSVTNDLYCVNGDKEKNKSCKCWPGYVGKRCEVFLCQNYCFHGDCTLASGQPECRCKDGFTGNRCEVDLCNNYCLNDGICSIELKKPVCKCSQKYEGRRCETIKLANRNKTASPSMPEETQRLKLQEHTESPEVTSAKRIIHQETEVQNTSPTEVVTVESTTIGLEEEEKEQNRTNSGELPQTEFTTDHDTARSQCNSDWDPIRDSIIMVLAILCAGMCVTSTLLVKKILHLKRRPRIRKRIIVNRNVTPLTARPDQCEITIEDCCNMNICETPCFEPRAAIRPNLVNPKTGKEDKLNLLAGMEHPDDLF